MIGDTRGAYSPYEEGLRYGITTDESSDYPVRIDNEEYLACEMSRDVHPALYARPDFLNGVGDGIGLRRLLHRAGLGVSIFVSFRDELEAIASEVEAEFDNRDKEAIL